MSSLESLIKSLRVYSLLLFLFPLIGLLGSLWLANHLVQYNIYYASPYGKAEPSVTECNLDNKFCSGNFRKKIKFHECSKALMKEEYYIDEKKLSSHHGVIWNILGKKTIRYLSADNIKLLEENKIYLKVTIPNKNILDDRCIKNSALYPIYEKSPFMRNVFYKIKNQYITGIAKPVFPFLHGEASISSIVKRFPQSYLFKPLLYLSSFFMVLYWINYKKIFFQIEKKRRINIFVIFGIFSAIFLLIHVFFLGIDSDILIFKKFRRLIIILFILSELAAQFFLVKRIFILKNILFNYTYKILIYLKITFVATILLITMLALPILIFFDPGSEFNNILEWNYFFFLLIFYLLSAMMWRRKPSVHTPEGM